MELVIGYFYPKLLNLYGDDGNVQILRKRAQARGIKVRVLEIGVDDNPSEFSDINLIFMGGGPDSSQKSVYEDLIKNKKEFLKKYIEDNGVGIFICGAYQLLGNYYKSADGSVLEGLKIFDIHTKHFGNHKPRCIGNVVCEINPEILNKEEFKENNYIGDTVVGFENHGGRTYLSESVKPFAKVKMGFGNNSGDGTEGVIYKNSIGTYLHGPLFSRNPHLADYLISLALKRSKLEKLDDEIIKIAHTASLDLKQ